MIIQLGSILQPLLEAGVSIGTQFLQRELGRDARRDQKDLIKAQARATGSASSAFAPANVGTVSPPFASVATPTLVNLPTMAPRLPSVLSPFPLQGPMLLPMNNNGVSRQRVVSPFAASRSERFVLDKASGQLRPKMPGEKGPTYRIDKNGDFVKVRSRRINPTNKGAAMRASRRIDAVVNFMSDLVRVTNKRDKGKTVCGKVVSFRTKRKKRKCS